jgi:hypothetical protein
VKGWRAQLIVEARGVEPVVDAWDAVVDAIVPVRVESEANARSHAWQNRYALRTAVRDATLDVLEGIAPPCDWRVALVRLTRQSPGPHRLDSDNLVRAFKSMRDAIALWLGVDDADARVVWTLRQERAADWGVHVEVLVSSKIDKNDIGCF